MAWHDANASLLASLRTPAPVGSIVFAGVFCTDPFRRDVDIFDALRHAGIQGIVNLPTTGFFDGELASIFDSFNLGLARELDFLRRGRDAGFRIAVCLPLGTMADRVAEIGAEFVIAHDGPPQTGGRAHPVSAAARFRRQAPDGPPVIGAEELLATLTG
jgi:predicted TIM-barrel enzyme